MDATYSDTESQLESVKRQIEQTKHAIARIKRERMPFRADVTRASFRLSNLRFKKWLRAPAHSYGLWKFGLLLLSPIVVGSCIFIIVDQIASSATYALYLCISFGAISAAFVAGALFSPNDSALIDSIRGAQQRFDDANQRLLERKRLDGLAQGEAQLIRLIEKRTLLTNKLREEINSGQRFRMALLQRNWKSMRDTEWEEYLVEVFRALGADAKRIGCTGDQGVDLLVNLNGSLIAVQAKGYYHAVSNKAVQEAYTGMRHHGCCACAVITNSRFTKSAHEVAASTDCILIGEEEFPDFVMGKFQFCSPETHRRS